jgi:hypothetical protein
MKDILSLCVSVLSILIGIIVLVGGYLFYGKGGFSEGALGWILATLGAPTTFLYWFIYKLGLTKSIISQYAWICFLYLLQYQIIAFLIYKEIINLSKKSGIIYLITIIIIVLISAKIMWNIVIAR